MTNTDTATLSLTHPTHGLFKVLSSHLNTTATDRAGWALDGLLREVESLTGGWGWYQDLNYMEALILISYLTGGASD